MAPNAAPLIQIKVYHNTSQALGRPRPYIELGARQPWFSVSASLRQLAPSILLLPGSWQGALSSLFQTLATLAGVTAPPLKQILRKGSPAVGGTWASLIPKPSTSPPIKQKPLLCPGESWEKSRRSGASGSSGQPIWQRPLMYSPPPGFPP